MLERRRGRQRNVLIRLFRSTYVVIHISTCLFIIPLLGLGTSAKMSWITSKSVFEFFLYTGFYCYYYYYLGFDYCCLCISIKCLNVVVIFFLGFVSIEAGCEDKGGFLFFAFYSFSSVIPFRIFFSFLFPSFIPPFPFFHPFPKFNG